MDNKITSNWIEDSYISTNVPEGRDGGLPMPLSVVVVRVYNCTRLDMGFD